MVRPANPGIRGDVVRRRRIEAGLRVAQLAATVGISAPYMSQIECGRRTTVSPEVFVQIQAALGLVDRRELEAPPAPADIAGDATRAPEATS